MNSSLDIEITPCLTPPDSALQALFAAHGAGDFHRLLALSEAMCRTYPRFILGYKALGVALTALGRKKEALVPMRRACELDPQDDEAVANLGQTLLEVGEVDEALTLQQQAVAINPVSPVAHNNLAVAWLQAKQFDKAMQAVRRAVLLDAHYAPAQAVLSLLLPDDNARAECLRQLDEQRRDAKVLAEIAYHTALVYRQQNRYFAALAMYREACRQQPNLVEAHCNLASVLQETGALSEALAPMRRALALAPNNLKIQTLPLQLMPYHADWSVADARRDALRYRDLVRRQIKPLFTHQALLAEKPSRLRVGLVSADLCLHAVFYFLYGVLAALHKQGAAVDFYAYPTGRKFDACSEQLRALCAAWTPIVDLDDVAAARQIHADGIHILFDLSGYTTGARLPMFALRPAPVQVSWLGWLGSTGMAGMDYFLADRCLYALMRGGEAGRPVAASAAKSIAKTVLSASEAGADIAAAAAVSPDAVLTHQTEFSERLWLMPDSWVCYVPPVDVPEVSPLPWLKNAYPTLGAFHNPNKVNDAVVARWAKILRAVPRVRFLWARPNFSDQQLVARYLALFAAAGIAAERITLYANRNPMAYWQVLREVDFIVDTFPCSGATTTCEALWMGVPTLTLHCLKAGQSARLSSCLSATYLHAVGLDDWICADEEAFVRQAKQFARPAAAAGLARLRAELRPRMQHSSLCDVPRWAGHFGVALDGMWRQARVDAGMVSAS